ncbi:hypothetical protein ACCO45_005817 [Purpureocillium lilacinum]|uniref:Uncharacterized protein n=1 Tax=Purpureocillium lilacinum TaxID=33203 RepID=A0ACC4DWJ4_PURLI
MTPAAARLKPTAAAIRRDGVVPGRTDVGEAPCLQVCHPPRHVCDSTRLNSKALPVKVLLETGPSTWFRASAPPGLRSTLGEITGAKGRGGGEKKRKCLNVQDTSALLDQRSSSRGRHAADYRYRRRPAGLT